MSQKARASDGKRRLKSKANRRIEVIGAWLGSGLCVCSGSQASLRALHSRPTHSRPTRAPHQKAWHSAMTMEGVSYLKIERRQ